MRERMNTSIRLDEAKQETTKKEKDDGGPPKLAQPHSLFFL